MTRILEPTPENLNTCAEALSAGGLVAFPTETVYGLGADARNGLAVARIFEAKGRPRFNPLITHVTDIEAASELARFSPAALGIARTFWPGPLTLVLPRHPSGRLSDLVTAGLDTVAVRIPDSPAAHALLAAFGGPVAAPSANRSGHVSPTSAAHVADDLSGKVDIILDGGECHHGLESTILDLTGNTPVLLRSGAIPREAIQAAIGGPLSAGPPHAADREPHQPTAPGQLASHYAPDAAMRLDALDCRDGEALLAFGPHVPDTAGPALNLSPAADLREAAANLFACLRALDRTGTRAIAVMPIPTHGLGEAINDRLQRAAAPRQPKK